MQACFPQGRPKSLGPLAAFCAAAIIAAAAVATIAAFSTSAHGQANDERLAIDANEDALTATLTYRGASVDVFGFADGLSLDNGRLAISVIGPQEQQVLRIMQRNALGMVTQGPPSKFDHLPGFWSLHATPEQGSAGAIGEFKALPETLQSWAFEQSDIGDDSLNVGLNALQAQINRGSLSVETRVNLRDNGLFNTTLDLPAFAPVGNYEILAHWFGRDGTHLVSAPKPLVVSKGPVASWITNTSINRALLYGLICVLVAISAGFLSEVVFRRFSP